MRSRVDLPERLRPVITRASWRASAKLTPAKIVSPPRSPPRFSATSRVLYLSPGLPALYFARGKITHTRSRTILESSLYARHQPQRSGEADNIAADRRACHWHGARERTAEMAVPAPLRVMSMPSESVPTRQQTRWGFTCPDLSTVSNAAAP